MINFVDLKVIKKFLNIITNSLQYEKKNNFTFKYLFVDNIFGIRFWVFFFIFRMRVHIIMFQTDFY